ncbi:MAG: RNA polymerase sigma factor [Lachnospiraceae bacterium]|nr:RNA polymerase sigma factor [Lachnospiraceae bacterium]
MKSCDIDQLVEQYSDSVYRYCKSITYTLEDAEDLYQQTFLKAFELHKKISLEKNPKAYLLSIATNIWRNHKSMYARRERIAPTVSSELEGVQIEDIRSEQDVLEQVVKEEQLELLRKCVDNLPEKQRQVITLFYAGELSLEEISKVLKIPKGTVKSRLHKAKEELRKEMEGLE